MKTLGELIAEQQPANPLEAFKPVTLMDNMAHIERTFIEADYVNNCYRSAEDIWFSGKDEYFTALPEPAKPEEQTKAHPCVCDFYTVLLRDGCRCGGK